jgi:hypothetical protein
MIIKLTKKQIRQKDAVHAGDPGVPLDKNGRVNRSRVCHQGHPSKIKYHCNICGRYHCPECEPQCYSMDY